ncbi:MAG: hypothetical protein ACLQCU_06095 [Acidimicrobiales bacterium]
MRFVAKAHLRRHAALVGAVALSAGVVAGILPSLDAPASAAPRTSAPVLLSINTASYPRVLGNSKKYSLYLLHDEAGGKLHCVGKCLQSWIPLYVAKGSHPSVGAGVKGKLGTVARKLSKADTKYQLTYNSFPVYTFSGDTGPKQSNGEGIEFATGVYWYLLHSSATTAAATPVAVSGSSGGGGGW